MADQDDEPTVLESFDCPLPELSRDHNMKYKAVGSSGTTTAKAVPPQYLISGELGPLEAKVSEVFNRAAIQSYARRKSKIPTNLGKSLLLSAESEVVFATTMYVLVEILLILKILYNDKWRIRPERSSVNNPRDEDNEDENIKPKKGGSKKKKGTTNAKENVRYDAIFEGLDEDGNVKGTIAVLEYKRISMIRYSDFKQSFVSVEKSAQELMKVHSEEVLLDGNGNKYTKQCSAYSRKENCAHVALFNWDELLLFEFCRSDTGFDAGRQAGLTWINETGTGGEFVKKCTIRKALLGWIIRAFESYFGE